MKPELRNKRTVLLVEDDIAVRNLVTLILERSGYIVLKAGSAEEALEVAAMSVIDTLVTDFELPRMNGEQLAQRLLATNPNIKVVIVTGYEEDRVAPSFVAQLLRKPFSAAALLEKILLLGIS